jgi:mannosyltransferase OCH1-like enzyme
MNNASLMSINSWRRNLPDYEIIMWNEEKIDFEKLLSENKFLKECYNRKLWAFVSDYLRILILYNEGGIYLDTDVEVIKSFDNLLNCSCFMGYEANDYIGTGIIGAEKKNKTLKHILDFYDSEIWNVEFYNNPVIFSYIKKNNSESFDTCTLFPESYFAPYNPLKSYSSLIEKPDTYAIHWYNANWGMSRKGYVFLNTKHYKNPVVKIFQIIRKNIGYFEKKYLK